MRRYWLHDLKQAFQKVGSGRRRRAARPNLEQLEDRTVLQSGISLKQAMLQTAALSNAASTRQVSPLQAAQTSATTSSTGSAQRNVAGSAQRHVTGSAQRHLRINRSVGASFTLPTGTTVNSAVTVPAGAEAISVPGLHLLSGVFAALLPGQTLPSGATVLSDVTVPAGAQTVTVPNVTLPTGTVAVPALGATLPSGQVVGVQGNSNATGSAARNLRVNTSAGVSFTLPTGTTVTPKVTVPAGATPISLPSLNLPNGAVLVLLPGQTMPAGATALTGVTVPTGAETITIPGITLPTGTLAVPVVGAKLPSGQTVGVASGSAQRHVNTSGSAQRNVKSSTASTDALASSALFQQLGSLG
jgi:hypothetical protein